MKNNSKARIYEKREGALSRLEKQLKSGTKVAKDGSRVPLEEKNIKRINKEVEVLKERLRGS
jgi:hypothetical protein